MLDTTKINFANLEDRLLAINSDKNNVNTMREMIEDLLVRCSSTLIMATGGSKVVAYFLKLFLEPLGIICEVIEPRDYQCKCKYNKECFSNLIVISSSGDTNGIQFALNDFKGNKYLVCENKRDGDYNVVAWGNENYEREKSFISLAPTLGPISMIMDTTEGFGGIEKEICGEEIEEFNKKISYLLRKSQEKIQLLPYSFKNDPIIHIITGYDTECSAYALASNLVESGAATPLLHEKGSLCHGRTTSLKGKEPIIYLSHENDEYDEFLIENLSKSCESIFPINSSEYMNSYYLFLREYYLLLQMYYLSKKIAEEKGIDLTNPKLNRTLVKPLYKYRGPLFKEKRP